MMNQEIARYDAYKDSGVEWIGEVPKHWEIKRLKETIIGKLSYGANESALDSNPSHPRYIRITDFSEKGTLKNDTFKSLHPDIAKDYLLKEGDILFARSGATAGKTFQFKNYSGIACYAGYLIKARPKETILLSDFLIYYTKSFIYDNWRNSSVIKATIENISAEKYGFFLFISLPPLPEQKAIADYLDTKTAQIDQKIDLLTQKATQYGKLKQSLINETVARGLDKTVVMKDSGVEWIGEVPEHWTVCKLRDIAFYQEGPGIMADDFLEFGVPLIRISGLRGSTVSLVGCNFIDPLKASNKWKHFRLRLGELVVSASATTGIVAKIEEEAVGAIPYTGLIRFKPRSKLSVNFLGYFLNANVFIDQIDFQKSGTTIQHYGPTHLGRVLAVLPPMQEQKAIADYLNTKTTHIDRIVETINTQINKLKELRKILINDVVTGKIKVAAKGDAV